MTIFNIDISGQIHNKWGNPTVLAIVSDDHETKCSIRIEAAEKKVLRKVFIRKEKTKKSQKHNSRVIALIFAYMIFRLIDMNYQNIEKVIICPDHRPKESVYRFLLQISSKHGYPILSDDIEIKFRNIKKRSGAHKYALKVLRKHKVADIVIKKKDVTELKSLIHDLIMKKMM